MQLLGFALVNLSHGCDKIPHKSDLREEIFVLIQGLGHKVHQDQESVLAGPVCIHGSRLKDQKADKEECQCSAGFLLFPVLLNPDSKDWHYAHS